MNKRTALTGFFSAVALFAFAHFSHHVLTALVVPLLPFIREEFSLSYTQAGLLVSAFTLANGFAQLPAGWLADRIGPRLLITVGISGVAVTGFLAGLSDTVVLLAICLVFMGLAAGGYHPAASPLISTAVDEKNRGKALGLHVVGGSTSYFLAPLLAGTLAAAVGWRGTFLWTALPVMVFGLVFYLFMRARQRAQALGAAAVAAAAETAPGAPAAAPPAGGPAEAAPGGRRGTRQLVVFLFLTSAVSAVVASTIAFLPLYAVDHFHTGEEKAAFFLALVYAAGYWGAPLGGFLSDRLGALWILILVGLAVGPLILLLGTVGYGLGFTVLLLGFGTFMFMRMPPSESFIVSRTPVRVRSTVLGVYFFAGMEGSAVLTPLLGSLIDRYGFRTSFTITGLTLTAVGVVCAVLLAAGAAAERGRFRRG